MQCNHGHGPMKYAGIILLSAVALACLAFYCRVKREGFKEDDRPAESKSGALEKAYDEMKTDDDCVFTYAGKPVVTSAGPCKAATVAGGTVS